MLQNTHVQPSHPIGLPGGVPVGPFRHEPPRFHTRLLDSDPALLEQSYNLRYQVYCLERRFLKAEDHPAQIEVDEFDRHSLHLGVVDEHGELAGTARLVQASIAGLPLFRHCQIFPEETELYRPRYRVVEVSRLSVSRQYRRRRDGNEALVISLYRGLYQVSKRLGFTHWLVATEPSLQRLVARFGFPFRMIGPEIDYFGPVAPYLMDLSEFDRVIMARRLPALETFLDGLDADSGSGTLPMAV